MELEAANKSDMTVLGMCSLELSVHGLVIHMDTVVVDLNCQAILRMDILGWVRNHPTSPFPRGHRMFR